ncbi:Protein-tyrosine-phosphatase [Gracilaria domingensis]|nr:Protein-tyrosine-phosphatase [Gracilaria domingensis]
MRTRDSARSAAARPGAVQRNYGRIPFGINRLLRRAAAGAQRSLPSSAIPTSTVSDCSNPSNEVPHVHSAQSSSMSSTPRPQLPAPNNRENYIVVLEARMRQMEKVPTNSFYHSYAGEFDMLLGVDRRAVRSLSEFETSTKVENAYRNRYANILSNERTRVKLKDVAPGGNDYINANLVTGNRGHPGYIATQAPLPETTPHFWQMVYESVSPVIIMLTREQEDYCDLVKSDQYWPPVGENLLFNDYLVHGIDHKVDHEHGVVQRRFQVGRVVDKRRKHARDLVHADSLIPPANDSTVWQTPARGRAQSVCEEDEFDCSDEELFRNLELIGPVLEVVQLQYLDWPDQNVPAHPGTLLDLCRRVDEILSAHFLKTRVSAPPIVHCSAGVGRTGTFIAIDRTLRRLWDAFSTSSGESRDPVPVEEIRELVRKLKIERSKMVQTAEQYRFIYEAVLAGMRSWRTGRRLFGAQPYANATNDQNDRDAPTVKLRPGQDG